MIDRLVGRAGGGLDIDSSSDSQRLSWNIGQVVTVLVWVLVLSKYLYAIVCKSWTCPYTSSLDADTVTVGLEKVFELRLPDEFTVQKKPIVKEDEEVSVATDERDKGRAIVATASAPVNSEGMWERQTVNSRHTD